MYSAPARRRPRGGVQRGTVSVSILLVGCASQVLCRVDAQQPSALAGCRLMSRVACRCVGNQACGTQARTTEYGAPLGCAERDAMWIG